MAGRRPIILDCDPGHDDAIAILLAAASPAVDLVAITTVAGNQTLARTTLNARSICSLAEIRDIPIAAGCDRPLRGSLHVAEAIHGATGLDGPVLPEPTVEADARHGVDLIVESALARDELTLVATGPLTNVATALTREPRLAKQLREIVFMGGAIGLGNWTPAAEFNVWADPQAAEVVLGSGVPVTMVPLEVTHRATATDVVFKRIEALGGPVSLLVRDLLLYFADAYHRVFGFKDPPVHDPCAVARAIDSSIVPTKPMHVAVETRSELTAGRTVCDLYGVTGRPPNAEVGIDLDVDRFWDLTLEALSSYSRRNVPAR